MKKFLAMLLAGAMAVSMVACSETKTEDDDVYKAALLINGNLGDKSFYDSANEGLTELKDELGEETFDFKVEQMGGSSADEAKWEPTLLDYCDTKDYDVIIVGTWQMAAPLATAAEQYPDQNFIFFDEPFNYESDEVPANIYNVMYKQNEVSYLLGAMGAMMTVDESIPGIDPSNKEIGFIGGMDNTVINDFLVGYIQGAKDTDPEVSVAISYIGDFVDSTKGKDLGLAQYQGNIDVGYGVAGVAGLGQIEAAVECEKYTFGVDSDQAALLPDYAANIPTSAVKNIGSSLNRAIKLDMDGKLGYGTLETLGFAEDGVEIVKGENYESIVPEDIRNAIEEIQEKITKGEIVVASTSTMSVEEIEEYKNSAK